MSYIAKKYDELLGIPGFSDKLLKAHFALYEGYVEHINAIIKFLNGADTKWSMTRPKEGSLGNSTG
jgi:Fe-Mn family superoxide dismutase